MKKDERCPKGIPMEKDERMNYPEAETSGNPHIKSDEVPCVT